ncbi:MAG: hypothetical protein KAR40_03785 [Candidatus Sabulitectum sp.]|nr:hypothetical protein [Candidatus Sabulitectum sp.]
MRQTILTLILITAAASAFTALPALGYSASSGFILGGFLVFPLTSPVGQFTIDTYYGTAGVIKFQPGMVRKLDNGLLSSSLEYRKVLEKKWYGWGNATNADSSARMDFEKRNLLVDFTIPADNGFFVTGGLDVRHSTVFNREESILWDRLPGDAFASTWTAGLNGRIGYVMPIPLCGEMLVSTLGFFQAGDVSYSGVTGKIKSTFRPWTGGEIALGARAHRQFNVADTPVPYASGIGQNKNFRGYSDCRFTGPVWTLYQFEIKEELFSLRDVEGNKSLTVAVTVFAEAGEVAEEFKELSVNGLHTDVGCGLRFRINPAAEMRIDAAWGDEGMLIQSGFDQAF